MEVLREIQWGQLLLCKVFMGTSAETCSDRCVWVCACACGYVCECVYVGGCSINGYEDGCAWEGKFACECMCMGGVLVEEHIMIHL